MRMHVQEVSTRVNTSSQVGPSFLSMRYTFLRIANCLEHNGYTHILNAYPVSVHAQHALLECESLYIRKFNMRVLC